MEQVQSNPSDLSGAQTQTPINSQLPNTATEQAIKVDLDAGMAGLDAASLAAKSIAQIAGLQNPEALAQFVLNLASRLEQIEKDLPDLMEAYNTLAEAAHTINESIPQEWKDDVSKVIAHVKHRFSLTF